MKNLSFQYPVNKAELPEGQAVHEQLIKLGYKPSDIDYILMSHMHCDHADGLRLVKNAKNILVSEEEYEAISNDKMHYLPHEWKGVHLNTFHFDNTGIGPKNRSFDLFGDGVIKIIFTPGHSPGHQSILLKLPKSGHILLTIDAAYTLDHWENKCLPGLVTSSTQAADSVKKLRKIARENNALVVTGHDPNGWSTFKKAPMFYYE